jgi:hypothetical protein
MTKYDYYLHKSLGFAGDYFGEIGPPFKVSMLRFYIFKLFRYRATRVPTGSKKLTLTVQSLINDNCSIVSYKAERLLAEAGVRIELIATGGNNDNT